MLKAVLIDGGREKLIDIIGATIPLARQHEAVNEVKVMLADFKQVLEAKSFRRRGHD